jgi:hypothetical protein
MNQKIFTRNISIIRFGSHLKVPSLKNMYSHRTTVVRASNWRRLADSGSDKKGRTLPGSLSSNIICLLEATLYCVYRFYIRSIIFLATCDSRGLSLSVPLSLICCELLFHDWLRRLSLGQHRDMKYARERCTSLPYLLYR